MKIVLTDPVLRFSEKVLFLPDGCWAWTGAKSHGYGALGKGRRHDGVVRAHRFAYELLVGPIPAGKQLDHLCRREWCVNPAHLEPVTNAENVRRSRKAKLNWRDIRKIKKLSAAGFSTYAIGRKYGVAPQHINHILLGKRWVAE